MSKITKISKQHPKTWAALHRRLIAIPFEFASLFSDTTCDFITNKAASINSNAGYLVMALLMATLFVLSLSVKLTTFHGFEAVPNIYAVFVGPPSTGKSQAMKIGASGPLNQVIQDKELVSFLIEKVTPSGLFKRLATENKGLLLSPEIYDVLFKLMKADDGTSNDISLLCELFSGEEATYTLATQAERKIPAGTPFSILGSTQLQPLAKLLVTMDEGQGLLDRFLFLVPQCFRPTPTERQQAQDFVSGQNVSFVDYISAVYDLHIAPRNYKFENAAIDMLNELEADFVETLNAALRNGNIPPQSKKMDIVQRIALAIHVTDHVLTTLLSGRELHQPPQDISSVTLAKALHFINYCDMQKNILLEFITTTVNSVLEKEQPQPTPEEIRSAILLFGGPVVSPRAFKQSGPRALRCVTTEEVNAQMKQLFDWGDVIQVKVARSRPVAVFVKRPPARVQWAENSIVPRDGYEQKYSQRLSSSLSPAIIQHLIDNGYVNNDADHNTGV